MRSINFLVLAFVLHNLVVVSSKTKSNLVEEYTPSWVVEFKDGGAETANKIAAQYGFENMGEFHVRRALYYYILGN